MVEGARLESVYRGNSIEGSNPSLSAIFRSVQSMKSGAPRVSRRQPAQLAHGSTPETNCSWLCAKDGGGALHLKP